jgi:hypothetical protein
MNDPRAIQMLQQVSNTHRSRVNTPPDPLSAVPSSPSGTVCLSPPPTLRNGAAGHAGGQQRRNPGAGSRGGAAQRPRETIWG